MNNNKHWFLKGLKDGIPIAMGYFAVSFALGFTASSAGLTVFQATLASLLCNASAGEYAGFVGIASKVSYLTMAAMIAIVNIRYLLMSASLSQKLPEETGLPHRLLVGFWITDEIFAASATVPGKLNPFYNYGLAISSLSFWALGTCFGAIVGNVVPDNVVSALGVLLYGMFLAIIIPPARENKILRLLIILAMSSSFLFSKLPVLSSISNAIRITILTILISTAAALVFPIKEDEDNQETGEDTSYKEAVEVKNAQ